MGRILRVGLMMMLVAAAGVGIARGEEWKTYNPGTPGAITWEYAKIPWTKTCKIRLPESNRSSISDSVTIPGKVEDGSLSLTVVEIAESAFRNCSKLEKIIIQNTVQKIGNGAFSGCHGLKEFKVGEGNANYCAVDSVLFTKGMGTLVRCPERKKGVYEIPGSVTVIGRGAFNVCDSLTAVTIPSSVQTIGEFAFSECKELKEVSIPEGVTTIGEYAFQACYALKKVVIPSSVKTIGGAAFFGCHGLTEVKISEGVETIGGGAFISCKGLTEVKIPNGVKRIESRAFDDCKGLNAVYWFVTKTESCKVADDAFTRIDSSATLYVRKGKKTEIKDKPWCKDKFSIVEFCVVTFDAKGGTPTPDVKMVEEGKTATAPTAAPTKEGYTFVEWQLGGVKYDFSTKVTEDITLVAVWKENTYTVTFDAKGGTPAPNAQEVVKDGTATAPTAPTKDGYTFVEWQLKGVKYDFSTKVTEDITLVAVWKEVVKYTVTFDAKGGAPTPNAQTVEEGKAATAPTAPTKDGYTFVEWQLNGVKYVFSTKVTEDITLVAVWKKNEGSTPSTPEDPKDPKTAVESVQLAGVRVVRNPVGAALELEGMERAVRVEVYSVVGARVHAEALRGEPRVVIDAQGWVHGVYVVKVEASDGARTLRVVK